ncbi:hypothetical protein KGY64_06680 [Candidatus Bipolaricaulota bacterium]|nr:hypothetical protein [Candidatus Bipolaricaulota bacterium]
MVKKSKYLVISLIFVLLIAPYVTVGAQDDDVTSSSASAFAFGTDAKSLAMGGAFVAVADNYSATYWNPAGLNQFSGVQLGGMNLRPHGVSGLNFSYGSGAVTISNFALGASFGQLGADLEDQLGYSDAGLSNYSETMFSGTLGYGIDFVNFGATVKGYQVQDGMGLGFDLGTLMTFDGISIGVAATDVGGVTIESEDSVVESTYRLGLAAKLLGRATAAAEVDLVGSDPLIKVGLEIVPIDQFALRAGVQVPPGRDPGFTIGAGVNLAGLGVDIAWLQNNTEFAGYDGSGDTLVLSAGFQFGAFGESAE